MKVGIVFPQTEFGTDPGSLRDFAVTVEELGYSDIVIYDHVIGAHPDRGATFNGMPPPYTHESLFHEPFALMTYLAAFTARIELALGVLILPQRQTALVAKQATEVDILSGGRLRLGVGTGWNHIEYETLGEDFHTRGRRQEEQVEVLRRLWTEELVTFHGKWHNLERVSILPRPERRIPIWFGGWDDRVLDRAARMGDGFYTLFPPDDSGKAALDRLDGYLSYNGRDRTNFGVQAHVYYGPGPEQWKPHRETWQEMGVDHICLRTMDAGLTTAAAHINAAREYMEAFKRDS